MALVRSDPFREIDRFFQQANGGPGERSWGMPMDAYRKDDMFLRQLDIPGIAADGVELTVDNNVLTIKAIRHAPTMHEGVEPVIAERPWASSPARCCSATTSTSAASRPSTTAAC